VAALDLVRRPGLVHAGIEADLAERARDGRVVAAIQASLEALQVDGRVVAAADEYQGRSLGSTTVTPAMAQSVRRLAVAITGYRSSSFVVHGGAERHAAGRALSQGVEAVTLPELLAELA
jgi:hypothetical protein